MSDVTRMTDTELVAHYAAEAEIEEWCFRHWVESVERTNRARWEIRRRGLDKPTAETIAATDGLPHEETIPGAARGAVEVGMQE